MIAATEPRWRAVCRTLSLPVEGQPAPNCSEILVAVVGARAGVDCGADARSGRSAAWKSGERKIPHAAALPTGPQRFPFCSISSNGTAIGLAGRALPRRDIAPLHFAYDPMQ